MGYPFELGDRTADQYIITLAEAKKNCKIPASETEEDTLLQEFVDSATDQIENYTDRIFVDREATIKMEAWENKIELPVSPVRSVTSVTYVDQTGVTQTATAGTHYAVVQYDDKYRTKIIFKYSSFPNLQDTKTEPFPITITVQCGYLKSAMPKAIKRAALMLVGYMESHREDMPTTIPRSVDSVLRPYRKF